MTELTPSIPKGSWILVTGANGFLASHIVRQFLQRGYKVRGTVRDPSKSSWLTQDVFKTHADDGSFEMVHVPDLGAKDAFADAVIGMSAIIHVAINTSLDPDPNKVIPHTLHSAVSLMEAALKEPSVKAFVYTSSVCDATRFIPGDTKHVERDSWNDEAVKLAWAPPPYDASRGKIVYDASNAEAEEVVWNFSLERKPHFSVNSVNPAHLVGEALARKHHETAYCYLKLLFDGNTSFMVPGSIPIIDVDVKDVALLHVAAALDPEVKDARLQAWGRQSSWNDVLAMMRKLYPQRKFIDDLPAGAATFPTTDYSQVFALLKKWGDQDGWTPLEETVADDIGKIMAWWSEACPRFTGLIEAYHCPNVVLKRLDISRGDVK